MYVSAWTLVLISLMRLIIAGEVVLDGTDFRNGAHFRFKADLFVPCGGRPEAVNVSNVAALCDTEGKPHFKYIVEGANLFITQQARLHLEKRRVVLFKDSSANKGKSFLLFVFGHHLTLFQVV